MKKKRKFSDGGKFELDADALASGLRMGRNERISDEDRAAAIAETTGAGSEGFKRLSDKEAADLMEREVNMPAAQAIPVSRSRSTGRPLPDMVSDQISRNVPAPKPDMVSDQLSRNVPAPRTESRVRGATPRPIPTQNQTLPNVTPRAPNIPSSPDASSGMTARPSESMRLRREKERLRRERPLEAMPMKKGGAVKASKRGDGIAQRGKTKGRML